MRSWPYSFSKCPHNSEFRCKIRYRPSQLYFYPSAVLRVVSHDVTLDPTCLMVDPIYQVAFFLLSLPPSPYIELTDGGVMHLGLRQLWRDAVGACRRRVFPVRTPPHPPLTTGRHVPPSSLAPLGRHKRWPPSRTPASRPTSWPSSASTPTRFPRP